MPKRKMTSATPSAKKPCLENTGTRKTGEKAIAAESMGGGCPQQTFRDVACDNNNADPAISSAGNSSERAEARCLKQQIEALREALYWANQSRKWPDSDECDNLRQQVFALSDAVHWASEPPPYCSKQSVNSQGK